MKKGILYALCVVLVGLGFQSCKQNDQKLQTDVENMIKGTYSDINASVKDGVVTLTGTLNSDAERNAVENTVRSIKNVKSVVNNITVKQPMPEVKVDTDATILSRITSQLNMDPYRDVKVQVINGEVILTGSLKRADLQKVMQIANEANAKKVTNNINLK